MLFSRLRRENAKHSETDTAIQRSIKDEDLEIRKADIIETEDELAFDMYTPSPEVEAIAERLLSYRQIIDRFLGAGDRDEARVWIEFVETVLSLELSPIADQPGVRQLQRLYRDSIKHTIFQLNHH